MCETPSGRGTRSITASASAIAGTSFGCTNDADSILVAPAAIARAHTASTSATYRCRLTGVPPKLGGASVPQSGNSSESMKHDSPMFISACMTVSFGPSMQLFTVAPSTR